LADHTEDRIELVTVETGFPPPIAITLLNRSIDPSPLGFSGNLSLCLGGCGHEPDKGIPDGLLDGVSGRSVESHPIDDRLDDHATGHELADSCGHVLVVSAKSIYPPDDEFVTGPKHIIEPPPLWTLRQAIVDSGNTSICHDGIEPKSRRFGLGSLDGDILVCGRDAAI
jgi:hypothetical protein